MSVNGSAVSSRPGCDEDEFDAHTAHWDRELRNATLLPPFHGDSLIGDKLRPSGFLANLLNRFDDVKRVLRPGNIPALNAVLAKLLTGGGLDIKSGAKLIASLSNDSNARAAVIESQVKTKYDRMLHPPLTYLGDAFKYRTADGKFNSALHPHLGQAGAPYAKTVPSKTHPLGALPDPADLFDRLMARQTGGRSSKSGLSSMLIYHATIIIHDIFRTNDQDKNISDSSSYLDLSPLYGYTEEMQRKVRDDKYRMGLLKPDTFAEDRLLRQPPGVCIMLVMYNRYHNYAATQLKRINENGRFSLPSIYELPKLAAAAKYFADETTKGKAEFKELLKHYEKAWKAHEASEGTPSAEFDAASEQLQKILVKVEPGSLKTFYKAYDAAWTKLDDDLFQTARLITCGQYIQVSIHDYLRALMGFHNYDTNFTLDPRVDMKNHENVSRGLGNQVTVEFNLLYRFHCAISLQDEEYAEHYIKESFGKLPGTPADWDPKSMGLRDFMDRSKKLAQYSATSAKVEPWDIEFGLPASAKRPEVCFKRNPITHLFDDQQMINALNKAMDDPISNFGPRNVPKCLKAVEILGIMQARKWEIGTLNDFREFFKMKRHETFESITPNKDVQDALRDLYEHPDKVELYPGVFCESDIEMGADPGPSDVDSALWAAIFSDAITLVRSDRFYTVDWNTNSLTSWGMKEVTPDNDVCKSSVFHRLLQRAFPGWYPYDSIRFFHPFYTAQKNAELAREQGYGDTFKMDVVPGPKNWYGQIKDYKIDTHKSDPNRPHKPVYLDSSAEIRAVLADDSDSLVHPARMPSALRELPAEIRDVLTPGLPAARIMDTPDIYGHDDAMASYFAELTRDIVKRERIEMDRHRPVYQLDATRDLAVPVITRYVAEFLGFDQLLHGVGDAAGATLRGKGRRHFENEIYQHITNCQTFLSYSSDETKLLGRRRAFRTSMEFLYGLTRHHGAIREAGKWGVTRWLSSALGGWKKRTAMQELGLKVAGQLLASEKDEGRAAAVMLLIGLDSAYNTVLALTAVLNDFMNDLYENPDTARWREVQRLAFANTPKSTKTIGRMVLTAQKRSVRLPIVRKALRDVKIALPGGKTLPIKHGQCVVCDIHAAEHNDRSATADETDSLIYLSGLTAHFPAHRPTHVAALALTSITATLAKLRNLRPAPRDLGELKRVPVAAAAEGYANFMAEGRVAAVEAAVARRLAEIGEDDAGREEVEQLQDLYSADVLRPAADTFLTPEWDEMVPFPTTWKVRFEGAGRSDYAGGVLEVDSMDDELVAPFYQARGPSHVGGSFAVVASCVCRDAAGTGCRCAAGSDAAAGSSSGCAHGATAGCGLPERRAAVNGVGH